MIDFAAICSNLAARYAPGTLATPSGATAIRGSLGSRPKAITAVPYAFVELDTGTITANSQWLHEVTADVVFCLSKRPGDPARVDVQRQKWLATLLAATEGKLTLGLAGQSGWTLNKALPTGWEFTEEQVGQEEWDAIRVHFLLHIYETVSLVP